MKTVLQNVKTGVISVEQVPPPMVRSGTVLVRNARSLVSAGTEKAVLEFSRANYFEKARQRPDLFRKVLNRARNEGLWQTYKIVTNLIAQPIQLGYSSAGVVTAVGSEIDDLRAGQRVACAGLFAATHSEVVSVPRNLVVPLPDGVSFDEAAFVTVGAIAMQGIRLAQLDLGERVVVFGLGLVGMVTAQLAVAAGCTVIGVDLDPAKVEKARGFGCIGVKAGPGTAAEILTLCQGYGADKVLLCAATKSHEPIELVPQFTRQKGVLVVVGDVGMNVPRRAYYDKEIDIRISRSYGPGRYDPSYEGGGVDYPIAYVRWTENRNMQAFLDLVARGRLNLKALVTHQFEINEAERAYQLISGEVREPYLGILLQYCKEEPIPVALPSRLTLPTSPRTDHNPLRLGIIGAGNFAKAFLLPAFRNQAKVQFKAICTASGVSAACVGKKYQATYVTADPRELLQDAEIDAVVIATRHDSHAGYVLQALRSGKAVFVEKPLATSVEDLDAIKDLVEERVSEGRTPLLMVGYNRRFSPLAQTLKRALASVHAPLSIMYRVNAGNVPATEWVHDREVGAGRIIGECCHFVDFMTFLTGQPCTSISASALQSGGKPVADVVTLTAEFADGSLGTVHYYANGHSSVPKELIEVHGGGVSARLDNFRSLKLYGAKAVGRKYYFNQVKGYEEEAAAFVLAVRQGTAAPIPFDQLYATCKATLVVEQSILTGRRLAC